MENENAGFPHQTGRLAPAESVELFSSPLEDAPQGPVPAGFNERFLAYVIDTLPVWAAAYALLGLMTRSGILAYSRALETGWKFLWIAAYLVYETVYSSGGRATVGKRIMGIRVKAANGEDLGIFRAFVRGLVYLLYFPGSPLFAVGCLIALVTPGKKALHDYIAGSRVVRVEDRGEFGGGVTLAVSWALMAVLCGIWINNSVLKMTPVEQSQVITAHKTIYKLGVLEEIYLKKNGCYTSDLRRLADLTGNINAVRGELKRNLAEDSLRLVSDGRGYTITARARNWRKTKVRVVSPAPQKKNSESGIQHPE